METRKAGEEAKERGRQEFLLQRVQATYKYLLILSLPKRNFCLLGEIQNEFAMEISKGTNMYLVCQKYN